MTLASFFLLTWTSVGSATAADAEMSWSLTTATGAPAGSHTLRIRDVDPGVRVLESRTVVEARRAGPDGIRDFFRIAKKYLFLGTCRIIFVKRRNAVEEFRSVLVVKIFR